ncbi:MAG: hypothetical protein KGM98_10340 [Bacteroidota bacterium]|nr:hypothetical protein [Bacteroidota bacterium]
MKTLIITLSLTIFSLGAFAQRKEERAERYRRPIESRVVVVPSLQFGIGYPYYGYPYYGYPLYGYPYYGYPYRPYFYHNSRAYMSLEMNIQSIRLDYKNRIQGVRHDKGLSHAKKRAEIKSLKLERNRAIIDAQRDYYHRRAQGYFYKNQGQSPKTQSPGSGS